MTPLTIMPPPTNNNYKAKSAFWAYLTPPWPSPLTFRPHNLIHSWLSWGPSVIKF